MKKTFLVLIGILAIASQLTADEPGDVMSAKYREYWNEDVQREIDERIEKYRKGDSTVSLENVKTGTEVKVEQIGHAFLFGSHIFNFNQLGNDEWNEKYKAVFGTLFNAATIAFYWKTLEPEPGKPRFNESNQDTAEFWNNCAEPKKQPHWRRPAPDPVLEFCESKGIVTNGHPLIWGNRDWHHPNWLPTDAALVDEMERLFEKRITEIAERYQDRIDRWDVVNESAEDFRFVQASRYGLMPNDYAFKAFQIANRVFPKSVLFNINDYAVNDHYADQINDLLGRGCRIDVVGIQMHLFNKKDTLGIAEGKPIQTPTVQFERLSAADKGGRPLHLSEITITAPDDDERGRAIQAEVARNLYRYWFSWPSMMGITWWNTVDDCGAPGEPTTSGLFTRNMEPKPSFYALNKLINDEWKTRFTFTAETEKIEKNFRGFKGTYRVTWTDTNGAAQSKEFQVQ